MHEKGTGEVPICPSASDSPGTDTADAFTLNIPWKNLTETQLSIGVSWPCQRADPHSDTACFPEHLTINKLSSPMETQCIL